MITRWAVKWLTNALKNDRDFWYAYQANIAVCFQDEVRRHGIKIESDVLHDLSNRAANNFLKIWTKK